MCPTFHCLWDSAELLPEAQFVAYDPAFHHLSAINAMDENLCRCAAYPNILAAIESLTAKKG